MKLFIPLLILTLNNLTAQQTFSFRPLFGKDDLLLTDPKYALSNGDSIQIDLLRFYISGVELLKDDVSVFTEANSFHLIDAAERESSVIRLQTPKNLKFNKLKFSLGIDSTTNVSGALGGDLDPTRGMYWTWQNGYINFKLEGKSNRCANRNHTFEFHLGGYQNPYETLQVIFLPVKNEGSIQIELDIQKFIEGIDFSKQNHVMSPGAESKFLSQKAKSIFGIHKL